VAKAKRVLQEIYKPLLIGLPDTDDLAVIEWAKRLEEQINRVLIRILQQNQDRLLAALTGGTGGITTSGITLVGGTEDWKIVVSGTKYQLTYNDNVVEEWDGA
jgi:uncharacterized lipoprotein YmbA